MSERISASVSFYAKGECLLGIDVDLKAVPRIGDGFFPPNDFDCPDEMFESFRVSDVRWTTGVDDANEHDVYIYCHSVMDNPDVRE